MRRVFLESDNEEALVKLESQAREMQVTIIDTLQDSGESEQPIKPLTRANLEEVAGSLSDLNLDATELRKKAWNRGKTKF